MASYDFKTSEEGMLAFWKDKRIYEQVKELGKKGKPYYFLDGPPYTSGKIHLGTAWNKSLKDMVLRYKRMCGLNVWDRAGYDMHGLPTENATQKKLKLQTKEDIERYGIDKFITECKKLCVDNMLLMNDAFKRLGVWMDFDNAYQSVTKEFMEAEWWLIKQAHEKGRLYEGLRTMTWCAVTESALAKHELEYKTVTDDSIFVKFKLLDKENEHLVIWTTTPWTIPFNLAVMVNPEVDYVKVKVERDNGPEYWYVANALVGVFLGGVVDAKYEIVETIKGKAMEGWSYEHPFHSELKDQYEAIKKDSPKAHTILLSTEYVDTSGGSGLVHCAPGCGPEDYEVGHANGIPPFNNIDRKGVFPKGMGKFSGLTAKKDDNKFTEALEKAGALIAITPVEHEYPHDWRHHEPVIFRTTKQWFFKVEDLKEKLVKQNDKITWVPDAAFNAFDSWLKNLRDNSISKQRYWGTPLPIWRNTDDPEDYLVIGSAAELEKLSGTKLDDLHIPSVNPITIKKGGKTYKRVPDILDVWVDAGTTSWTCLDYPQNKKDFDKLFPAEFILEGKDQIRGWFNLLHIASNLAFDKPCYKNVYMHGFINDAQGRKMSKSQGNYILPDEVVEKYGANTLRYYVIGAANPGLDMNYNFDDVELKHRNLLVYWNIHNLLLQLRQQGIEFNPKAKLGVEEKYILSRLHSTIKKVTEMMEGYRLNEVPYALETLLLDLSRNYIQLVREKLNAGSDEEKQAVLYATFTTYHETMKMFGIVAPMFAEQVHQNFKEAFKLKEESIHFCTWPMHNQKRIDTELEADYQALFGAIGAGLAARDSAKLGVRWPASEVVIETNDDYVTRIKRLEALFKQQVNVKKVRYAHFSDAKMKVEPNYKTLGKVFGQETTNAADFIRNNQAKLASLLEQGKSGFAIDGYEFKQEHFITDREVPFGWSMGTFSKGSVFLNVELTPALEAEGFAREVIRRVQQLRKDAGLQKNERITLYIEAPELESSITAFSLEIKTRVGADELELGTLADKYSAQSEATIKGKSIKLALQKM
ncbi:isoleucine--tRNA ligase [Candidatus Woesearchaeota archaeon]|nr:isoleucine--tRNA ligase [Candidatus Woesearchaeota archaeon]